MGDTQLTIHIECGVQIIMHISTVQAVYVRQAFNCVNKNHAATNALSLATHPLML